ncbi:hypothetical protein SH139x_001588 [Planctomycetaceae bacterium SH139]
MFRRLGFSLFALLAIISLRTQAAERPTAPRLLPEKTLAYVRIANVNEMRETTAGSSVGRMMADEQLKPLVGDVYLTLEQLFSQVSDRVGVSLTELLSLPQGEVAFAVIPMDPPEEEASDKPRDNSPEAIRARIEARRNQMPVGFVAIVETADQTYLMNRLVERVEEQMPPAVTRSTRLIKGTEVVRLSRDGAPPFAYAEKDGTYLMGVGNNVVEDVLERWDEGSNSGTLAQSTDFGNVMSHCVGAEETRPQVTFYFDPYHLVERLVKAQGGAAGAIWPIVEGLKLDKLQGIGGSTFSSPDSDFESIIHIHVLLESPRDGFLSVVRPGEGSIQPEDWVPDDIVSYTTLHWDILQTYEGVGRIIARFQGSDVLERSVEKPFKEGTGVDLRADILEQVTGRIGIIRWNEPPMRLNSNTQLWALEVKEIAAVEETVAKLAELAGSRMTKDAYAGQVVYSLGGNNRGGNFPENLRRPEPTLAFVGNYVIGSDSRKAIEHIIDTKGGQAKRLSSSPDYELIAGEVSGKLDSQKPFLFTFMRGEEALRQIYELARDPKNQAFLKQQGENNPVVKMFSDTLEKHELPAFSAFSKYFAPSGGFAYDDPTGIHYSIFTLRPLE